MFTLLFGAQTLDFGPRDVPRMIAEIGLAKKETSPDTFELIPSQKLGLDLPSVLVEDHVHWFNLKTRTMEARLVETLWKSSPDNWRLHFSSGSHLMTKGDARLFDVCSQTWQILSKRLQALENPMNLIITLENSDTVSVDLPCCSLSFFINDKEELECHHPCGMVYDERQSVGMLIGLANKLVLQPKANSIDEGAWRLVLVPEGDVSFTRQDGHVRVMVDTSGSMQKRFLYQLFWIDSDLGCLIDNASYATLASNLYQAYLHALTSKPSSVDPLMQRTGTEEALSILHSAACWSFMKVDTCSAKLLCCIAELTAHRTWYLKHLNCMQNVCWLKGLPVASQHCGFYIACSSIKEIQQQQEVFHEKSTHEQSTHEQSTREQSTPLFEDFPPNSGDHLLLCAAIRAAVLYPEASHVRLLGCGYDSVYEARDA
ncbi:hypothetical protein EDD17DRAFT_1760292 [Pisolithus thermaeus]|nr:hypothetical protein EDD17DRAFT_1760292 [Pisolithus thermaeus]